MSLTRGRTTRRQDVSKSQHSVDYLSSGAGAPPDCKLLGCLKLAIMGFHVLFTTGFFFDSVCHGDDDDGDDGDIISSSFPIVRF